MLVRCKYNCPHSATTDAALDLNTDEAVCTYCGEILEHISSYAKRAMKSNGDVINNKKGKAFTFRCETCNKKTVAIHKDGKIKGEDCPDQDCDFNITEYMKRAIKLFNVVDEEE